LPRHERGFLLLLDVMQVAMYSPSKKTTKEIFPGDYNKEPYPSAPGGAKLINV
jgi:hypothetical protein